MLTQFREAATAKLKNMKHLYGVIRKQGPVTKAQLIDLTGLKQTTCTRIINDLLAEKLIVESGVARSSGGRKPVMYVIDAAHFYSIGIDISRTFTKVLLLDLHLQIKDEARFPMDQHSTPDRTIDFIRRAIENFFKTHHITADRLLGIGIGAVEPLDRESGVILDPLSFPAEHWNDVAITEQLSASFPVKVLLDKGANTAVLAEHEIGLNGLVGNLAYMIPGAGVRLSVMTDHQLFQGPADRYERFGNGHMVVNADGRKCICGSYGCAYTYTTIPAFRDEVIEQLKRGHASILTEKAESFEAIDFDMICQAAEQGDMLVCNIAEEMGFYAGIALSNIAVLLHPDRFILGGPLFNRMELFYRKAVKTAEFRLEQLYPGYKITFSRSHFGENTAAIGAGSMVLDYYLT